MPAHAQARCCAAIASRTHHTRCPRNARAHTKLHMNKNVSCRVLCREGEEAGHLYSKTDVTRFTKFIRREFRANWCVLRLVLVRSLQARRQPAVGHACGAGQFRELHLGLPYRLRGLQAGPVRSGALVILLFTFLFLFLLRSLLVGHLFLTCSKWACTTILCLPSRSTSTSPSCKSRPEPPRPHLMLHHLYFSTNLNCVTDPHHHCLSLTAPVAHRGV